MLKVAAIQMKMNKDKDVNRTKAESMVREAAAKGAQIILLPELFEGLYFCKDMDKSYFSWAKETDTNPLLKHFQHCQKSLVLYFL